MTISIFRAKNSKKNPNLWIPDVYEFKYEFGDLIYYADYTPYDGTRIKLEPKDKILIEY